MNAKLRNILLLATFSAAVAGCSDGKGVAGGTAQSDPSALHIKTGCDRFFFGGNEPQIVRTSLAQGAKRICYRSFAVAFSPVSRTAMWSAEVVDPTTVRLARKLARHDEFHPEEKLAPKTQAERSNPVGPQLSDYRGSGYDRGHLAPSGDMPTMDSQGESFSLANIVPQAPRLNRGSWAELESDVRDQSLDVKRIYVVTGPVFNGKNIGVLKRRVMIPTHIWKAMLIPSKGATVYIASNTDYPVWKTMSVEQFTQFSGINPFPGISDEMAKSNMTLGEKSGKGGSGSSTSGSAANTHVDPWNPQSCGAPWRPTQDPHYGHCHPIEESEAQYGLTPGAVGPNNSTTSNSTSSTSSAAPAGNSWQSAPGMDPQDRLRQRNRDKNRDRDR